MSFNRSLSKEARNGAATSKRNGNGYSTHSVSVSYEEETRKEGLFSRLFGNNNGRGNGLKQNQIPARTLEGLRGCLDNMATNVFVADADLNLVYMNVKAKETAQAIEDEIKKTFSVGVDELVGGSIHRFHRDPERVEKILRNPSALPHTAEFNFGSVALRTSINVFYGSGGETLGYVVNWEEVSAQKTVERERVRIVSMMDNAPINMMYADRDFNLQYMNPASFNALKTLEQYLPKKVDQLVGKSIDIFHRNPGQVWKIVSDPRNLPYKTQIHLGPEILDLLVSPIYGENDDYLGPMVSWSVVTEKLELEKKADDLARRERDQAEEAKRKVGELLPIVDAMAAGDLTNHVTVTGDDALGRIGSRLSGLISDLRRNISAIASHAQELAASSRQISSVSQTVSANAEQTAAQSNIVLSASGEVNACVQTVAAGAEEMSASIKEIALSAAEAAKVASSAVKIATEAGRTVSQLGESSSQIGQVLKMITSIAEQTNLLALNATIEAARAGVRNTRETAWAWPSAGRSRRCMGGRCRPSASL